MIVDENTSIAEIMRTNALERYARSARAALEYAREYYWEKAGIDWKRLEQEWQEVGLDG